MKAVSTTRTAVSRVRARRVLGFVLSGLLLAVRADAFLILSTEDGESLGIEIGVSDQMIADPASSLLANAEDRIEIAFGNPATPLLLMGTIEPAPELQALSPYPGCPACGDGVRERWETCDDGNLVSRDGCSSACETEAQ